jgi:hypothetical protein
MRLHLYVLAVVCVLGFASAAEAKKQKWVDVPAVEETNLPTCLDKNRQAIRGDNNAEVLRWKEQTKNQYKDRALISGVLVGVILDRKSHLHLEVNLTGDENSKDAREHIEIVYNKSFGEVAAVSPGMKVQACGDYITSNEQSGPYKPSPMGAIVHWVHKSNTPDRHASGFLAIDGKVYGLEDEKGGRNDRRQDQRQRDNRDDEGNDWQGFLTGLAG